jgi:hypothetical protein
VTTEPPEHDQPDRFPDSKPGLVRMLAAYADGIATAMAPTMTASAPRVRLRRRRLSMATSGAGRRSNT